MNLLVMGIEEREALARLKDYAEHNPFSIQHMQARMEGKEPAPGDFPDFKCQIPMGYGVAFTIEPGVHPDTREMMGMVRRVSIMVGHKVPHPSACAEIMKHLGFQNSIGSGKVGWQEEYFQDGAVAMNLWENIE